jgi:hypothetical protein
MRSAIQYVGNLCEALSAAIDHPAPDQLDFGLWAKDGKNDFGFLKK